MLVLLEGGQRKTIPWLEAALFRLREEGKNRRTLRTRPRFGSAMTRSGNPCGKGDSTGVSYELRLRWHAKVRVGRCQASAASLESIDHGIQMAQFSLFVGLTFK